MLDPIEIKKLSGYQVDLAKACDDGNGVLENNEVSIFNELVKIVEENKSVPDLARFTLPSRIRDILKNYLEIKDYIASAGIETRLTEAVNKAIEVAFQPFNKNTTAGTNFTPIEKFTPQASLVPDKNKQYNVEFLNTALNNRIKRYLKIQGKKNSSLMNTAEAFIKAAEEKGIDPILLMSVAIHESAYGTSRAALDKNNIGGLMANGKVLHYENISDSISIAAKVLAKNKNLGSISKVAMEGNYVVEHDQGRALWCKNIISYANDIRNEYNKLLDK